MGVAGPDDDAELRKKEGLSPFLALQVDFIICLQRRIGVGGKSLGARFLQLVSVCGTGGVIYPATALSGWFLDVQMGRDLMRLLVLNMVVMSACKTAFKLPRPQFVTRRVAHHDPTSEASFGFPSGHTLVLTAMLGYSALLLNSTRYTAFAVALVALTMVSRLYTGAHFVVDVVGGLFFGLALLAAVAHAGLEWCHAYSLHALSLLTLMVMLSTRNKDGLIKIKLVSEANQACSMALGIAIGEELRASHGMTCGDHVLTAPVAGVLGIVGLAAWVGIEELVLKPRVRSPQGMQGAAGTIVRVIVESVKHTWVTWAVPCVVSAWWS